MKAERFSRAEQAAFFFPREGYQLASHAKQFLPKMGYNLSFLTSIKQLNPLMETRVLSVLGDSIFDRGLRLHLGPQPEGIQPINRRRNDTIRPEPVYVLSSSMVESLEQNGYRFIGGMDIAGVGQANKIHPWAADTLIRGTIHGIIDGLAEYFPEEFQNQDILLARLGAGDEIGLFENKKREGRHLGQVPGVLLAFSTFGSGLFPNGQGQVIERRSSGKPIELPTALKKRKRDESLVLSERILRLKTARPDIVEEIDVLAGIPDINQRSQFIQLVENASYDPLLQFSAERMSSELPEINVYAYSENNCAHFLRQAQKLGEGTRLLRVGPPGFAKFMNDNPSMGRDRADDVIIDQAEKTIRLLRPFINTIHMYRDEGYPIIAIPENVPEETFTEIKKMLTRADKSVVNYEEIAVPIVTATVPFILSPSLSPESSSAALTFQQAVIESKNETWKNAIQFLVPTKSQEPVHPNHLAMLIEILHPENVRTISRIKKMGFEQNAEYFTHKLKKAFSNRSEHRFGIRRTTDIDDFMNEVLTVLREMRDNIAIAA